MAQKVAALSVEVSRTGYSAVSARSERNFQILCKEWFDLFVAPGLASCTEEHRRTMMNKHLFAEFGELEIKELDTNRLQRFFNAKVKAELSADYIGKMKNLLNNFFQYAVKQHNITENPMSDVVIRKRSTVSKKSGKALRPEIRETVLSAVMKNPVLAPIIFTFTLTGLRPQELIALKWPEVNLESKTISVKQAVNRTRKFDSDGNVIEKGEEIGKTKTPKSVRTILMPDVAVDTLMDWRQYCQDNNINSEFVFPCTETSRMRTYSGLRSMLERFKRSHNLQDENLSLYTFRHTFATILLEQRENPKIVAELMGHTKVSTTLDMYSTVYNTVYEQTAQTLNSAFVKLTKKNPPNTDSI